MNNDSTTTRVPGRSAEDWEALVGGNWLNKIGVFVLVIGIALALGYSFTKMGPGGRVAAAIAVSFAMLITGAVLEPRERYRVFARGLLGGGWAALYFTVYAMQSLDPARVIYNPWLGAVLLLAVAVGMILHSLRYQSEAVTGIAYFLAFVTLGITQVTSFSVMALVPLAASLLYVAYRFGWRDFALLGLVATYVTCALRVDGAGLAIFAVYWILFEAFDILMPHPALLPLNAFGFLSLSIWTWHGEPWMLMAGTAAAYLVSAALRWRSDHWRRAATLTAALAAAAIFLMLDHQWIALALMIEAELIYLSGVRLRAPYLRALAAALFGVQLGHMMVVCVGVMPYRTWTPVAALETAIFYGNRARRSDQSVYFGYVASGLAALVAGNEVAPPYLGRAWYAMAGVTYAVGCWRKWEDFRFQGYGLGVLATLATAAGPYPPIALVTGAVAGYALALGEDRAGNDAARFAGSFVAAGMLAGLVGRLLPQQYLGLGWMALAIPLLELGIRGLPRDLRRQSYALAAFGTVLVIFQTTGTIQNTGPLEPRLIPLGAAVAAYAFAARGGAEVLAPASFAGTGFLLTALWALLTPDAVGPAWAAVAVVLAEFGAPELRRQSDLVSLAVFARLLFVNMTAPERMLTVLPVLLSHYYLWSHTGKRFYLYTATTLAAVLIHFQIAGVAAAAGWAVLALALIYAGTRWNLQDLCWQSYALAIAAFARCWYSETPVAIGAVAIACFLASHLIERRAGFSLLATLLAASMLYNKVSGSMVTVAWGLEGVALLAAGFPLRDRVLRISGLSLFGFCILKLLLWDLRHLDTFPRILSFLVLGAILVGVSFVYATSRYRRSRRFD
jgi:uncharacterized membrane protein